MSFQQAIANQRNYKNKDEQAKITTSCIGPPTPKTIGKWTEVKSKPSTKQNTKPPEIEIFPISKRETESQQSIEKLGWNNNSNNFILGGSHGSNQIKRDNTDRGRTFLTNNVRLSSS